MDHTNTTLPQLGYVLINGSLQYGGNRLPPQRSESIEEAVRLYILTAHFVVPANDILVHLDIRLRLELPHEAIAEDVLVGRCGNGRFAPKGVSSHALIEYRDIYFNLGCLNSQYTKQTFPCIS